MFDERDSSGKTTQLAILFEGGLIVLAVAIAWLFGRRPLPGVELTWEAWPDNAVALGWGLAATAPMVIGLIILDRCPVGPFAELHRFVQEKIAPLFAGMTVVEMGLVSLAAGFGEEMLFRGLLQPAMADWIGPPYGVWIGLIVAALVFGVCHWVTTTYALLAALMGVYFGVLLITTDSLLPPIVAHALYDFFALLYLVRWKRSESEPELEWDESVEPWDEASED